MTHPPEVHYLLPSSALETWQKWSNLFLMKYELIVWGCSFLEANCPSNSLLQRLLSFEINQWKPIEAIPIKLKLQRDNIVWKWRTTQPTKDARLRFFLTLFEIQICQFWEKSHLSLVWNDGSFSSFLYLVSGMIGGEGNVFYQFLASSITNGIPFFTYTC